MNKKLLILLAFGGFLAAGCGTAHYEVSGVSRNRVLIDKSYDANPDAKAVTFIMPYKHTVDSMMSPLMGHTAEYMWAQRPESNLTNLLADILMWAAPHYGENPDFGIYNIGGMRAALPKGKVTYGDIQDVAPFENRICFVSLMGDKVLELFQQIMIKGGEAISGGVRLVYDKDKKLKSATINGQPVDPKKNYRIVTIDYVAEGNDKMAAFHAGTDKVIGMNERDFSRFTIMDYFQAMEAQGKIVDSKVEGRITIEE